MLRDDYLVSGNAWHFPKLWKTTEAITLREFLSIVCRVGFQEGELERMCRAHSRGW
jgi:hypothetical protein